jgi:hypothetical protein
MRFREFLKEDFKYKKGDKVYVKSSFYADLLNPRLHELFTSGMILWFDSVEDDLVCFRTDSMSPHDWFVNKQVFLDRTQNELEYNRNFLDDLKDDDELNEAVENLELNTDYYTVDYLRGVGARRPFQNRLQDDFPPGMIVTPTLIDKVRELVYFETPHSGYTFYCDLTDFKNAVGTAHDYHKGFFDDLTESVDVAELEPGAKYVVDNGREQGHVVATVGEMPIRYVDRYLMSNKHIYQGILDHATIYNGDVFEFDCEVKIYNRDEDDSDYETMYMFKYEDNAYFFPHNSLFFLSHKNIYDRKFLNNLHDDLDLNESNDPNVVMELFDKKTPLKITRNEDNDFWAVLKINGRKFKYIASTTKFNGNVWEVQFIDEDGRTGTTGKGSALEALGAAHKFFKLLIKHKNPSEIEFSASIATSEARANVYQRMFERDSLGYEFSWKDHNHERQFKLVKVD